MKITLFNNRLTNIEKMLDGEMPIPDHYHVGSDCKRNHGKNGNTVRDKRGHCVGCSKVRQDANRRGVGKEKNRDMSALHKYEEMQEKEHDEWDYEL